MFKDKSSSLISQAQPLYRLQQSRAIQGHSSINLRLFTTLQYQAMSGSQPRRMVGKVEGSDRGLKVRFVVTHLKHPRSPQRYDLIYGGRGQMENFIKNHKTFLHSDRTSCHTFFANAFRLMLHSAAYILLHGLAEKALEGTPWWKAQFHILQLRLLKVALKVEEMATKIKFPFPASFPLPSVDVNIMAN